MSQISGRRQSDALQPLDVSVLKSTAEAIAREAKTIYQSLVPAER